MGNSTEFDLSVIENKPQFVVPGSQLKKKKKKLKEECRLT